MTNFVFTPAITRTQAEHKKRTNVDPCAYLYACVKAVAMVKWNCYACACNTSENQTSTNRPISLNVQKIAACSKLAKFYVQILQDICNFYQLDISTINVKRKKRYIDLLTKLVGSCSCNESLWNAIFNIESWGQQTSSTMQGQVFLEEPRSSPQE